MHIQHVSKSCDDPPSKPPRMKTLSSRAAECNSTTLARLADGLVRLRVKSPETQEVLQELAEVQVFVLCFIGGYLGWDEGIRNCGVWWRFSYHECVFSNQHGWGGLVVHHKWRKARWYIMSQSLAMFSTGWCGMAFFCRNLQVRELCQLCDVTTKTNNWRFTMNI